MEGRVVGRWMARAPPTPKNHATAAHAAAHTPDDKGQQKCVHEKKQNPADLKCTTRASRGGMLLYRRGAA